MKITRYTHTIAHIHTYVTRNSVPLLSGGGSRQVGAAPSRGLLVELSPRWGEALMAEVGLADMPCWPPPGLKLPKPDIPEPGLFPDNGAGLLVRLGGPGERYRRYNRY